MVVSLLFCSRNKNDTRVYVDFSRYTFIMCMWNTTLKARILYISSELHYHQLQRSSSFFIYIYIFLSLYFIRLVSRHLKEIMLRIWWIYFTWLDKGILFFLVSCLLHPSFFLPSCVFLQNTKLPRHYSITLYLETLSTGALLFFASLFLIFYFLLFSFSAVCL